MSVIDINVNQPHLVLDSLGGNQHVIPVAFFEEVSIGAISITELEDYDKLMPMIINEWLLSRL